MDVHIRLATRVVGQRVRYNGVVTGDAFPDLEVFVFRAPHERMLHAFSTQGSAECGPYRLLPGDNRRPMGLFYCWD